MEPDEIDRAVTSAEHYVDTQMAPADLVSIVSLGSALLVNQDFTSDHELLKKQLQAFSTGAAKALKKARRARPKAHPTPGSRLPRTTRNTTSSIRTGAWKDCVPSRRSSRTFSRKSR